MVKILLFFDIVLALHVIILAESTVLGFQCCTCYGRNTLDLSYSDCLKNHTCKWTCGKRIKCGPDLNSSAKQGPPIVTSNYKTFNLLQDNKLQIPCKIHSNSEANVTWLFNGRRIDSYPDKLNRYTITTSDCGSVLEMRVLVRDQGKYTCLAQNVKGSGSKIFTVTVDAKPTLKPVVNAIDIDSDDKVGYLGTTVNLSCQVNFNPSSIPLSIPLINFLRNGKNVRDVAGKYENIPRTRKVGSLITRKLSLKNLTMEERGEWMCYGTQNGVKGATKSLDLKIVPCPAGYFCPWNESKKYDCPYGTYSDGSTNITYQCTKCPGTYPNNKPLGHIVPAKSVEDCQATKDKPSDDRKTYLFLGIMAFCVVMFLGILLKFYKSRKRILVNTVSDDELLSTPSVAQDAHSALILNDHCAYETETRLSSPAEAQEFPIKYDLFISYSSKDVDFATEIHRELERQSFKCCIHIRDFTPGVTIIDNISNAIYGSRVTLVILSPDFVESEWCKSELQQALTRSMRNHRVIPILYKNCQIPRELLHRTYIDYENCYVKPYFWEQLNKTLSEVKLTAESII